jgi:NhaP-type Na+/H+ or K+/H+ antiporter
MPNRLPWDRLKPVPRVFRPASMHDVALKLAVVAAGGILAQWVAWRTRLPAIVLLLVGGFVLGPLTGWLDPATDFGAAYRPVVSIAVAIILFEGGLTLNVAEIRETSKAVRRLILFGGPLVWGLTALAAHFVAGLSWPTASVLGAILVVTGPTVVMPLLRQAHLATRPASLLRWEAIVNDAIGALFAVIAFETFLVLHGSHGAGGLIASLAVGTVVAVGGGYAAGSLIEWAFTRGYVPEYLKAPVLLATVIAAHALTNMLLEEAGLLTVTVMGIRLANSRIASLAEMRRFKETVTILLVSGLFLLLTAALDMEAIRSLDWRAVGFVALVMFVIRPLAVVISTAGSGITLREQLFVGWIAPRGIVAVAVASLFAAALSDNGVNDAPQLVAYTFAVVVATVFAHGFTLAPFATLLGLTSASKPGILIVGGSPVMAAFAATLKEAGIPVMIADTAWSRLREARLAEIPVYFGEVLSEEAHYDLDVKRFAALIATTSNDAYNALVCTNLGPEIGRTNVFEIPTIREQAERKSLSFTLGGRPLTRDPELRSLDFQLEHIRGWGFQATRITEEFSYQEYLDSRAEGARVILWRKPSGKLVFRATTEKSSPEPGDLVISFAPPRAEKKSTE